MDRSQIMRAVYCVQKKPASPHTSKRNNLPRVRHASYVHLKSPMACCIPAASPTWVYFERTNVTDILEVRSYDEVWLLKYATKKCTPDYQCSLLNWKI